MNTPNLRTALYSFVMLAFIFAASGERTQNSVYAQHEGHDMSGMEMRKPKPTPQKKKPATQNKTKTTPDNNDRSTHDTHNTISTPAATPTPPATSSSPMPAEMDMNMAMPTPTPSAMPAASPAEMNMTIPTPTPTPGTQTDVHSGDMQDMNNAATPTTNQSGATHDTNMSGMDMSGTRGMGRMSASDPNALMVMSGDQMDIRVGSRQSSSMNMGQMGSGTSWQPSTTPMFMWFKSAKGWLLFLHGEMKLGVNSQGGPRGVTKFESQNWIMPMAFRRVGPGTLQLRGMFSLEAFTLPPGGSPELFQTGETFRGRPLIDAQHPHDLFMELSATYTMPVGEHGSWFTYIGFPGEPALGPTAFMHRWSASENPSAPLTHHLQDSTHISFGVFTTGFTYRKFKLEGSLFNGREPDENRYNFEFNPWNSRSVRVSFAPNENWSAQWSYGLLKNPEALEPGDTGRMTASLSYNRRFARGNWATSLIWGRNREDHADETFHLNGYTAESTVNLLDKNYLYTRLELVDKKDLLRSVDRQLLGITEQHPQFRIGAYTFGAARDVWNTDRFSIALGADATFYSKPAALDPLYGNNPVSYHFFMRIRPNKMSMSGGGRGNVGGHTH